MDKQLLIIGIDPGTTLGYAVIDFEGELVKVHSGKNIDFNSLISRLISLGKPLIVASDKEYNPDLVSRVAVKLGARVIAPDYDLKVSEKRELVRDYETGNQHEIDALASALFALKKISPLLKKINIFVEHYKKEGIKQQLIEFVVGKELNIRDAAEIIEGHGKEEVKIIKEVVKEKKLREKDFLVIYKKYKEAKKDVSLLREQNKKLRDEMTAVKRDYEYMFKQISKSQQDRKMQSLLSFKERRVNFFDRQLKKNQEVVKTMQDEITLLLYFLSNINSSVLLKKLDNLGLKDWGKRKHLLGIKQGDVLLVKDIDIRSDRVVDVLIGKVEIILYRKPISKKVAAKLPFVFINANKLDIEENEYFGIVSKKEFDKVKSKLGMLDKIVEDYKRERSD